MLFLNGLEVGHFVFLIILPGCYWEDEPFGVGALIVFLGKWIVVIGWYRLFDPWSYVFSVSNLAWLKTVLEALETSFGKNDLFSLLNHVYKSHFFKATILSKKALSRCDSIVST